MASISVNKGVTASTQGTKVTLTNWQRLNNSPIVLPEASAVQWNEYVFVLARDGRALLYHSKHGMWSSLPQCDVNLLPGPPLAVYNEEIITVSDNGKVASFDIQSSDWEWKDNLRITVQSQYPYQEIVRVMLVVNNDNLHAVVEWTKQQSRLITKRNTITICDVLSYIPHSGWETDGKIGVNPLSFATMAGTDLYVGAGEKLYKVVIPEQSREERKDEHEDRKVESLPESIPDRLPVNTKCSKKTQVAERKLLEKSSCKKPPFTASTLHVVKDTLFSFGGRDKDNQPSSDVLRYNPDSDLWESAGYMRSARYNVVVTTVQQENDLDVFVMGGCFGNTGLEKRPKLGAAKDQAAEDSIKWDCSSCIVEKCMVE